MAATVWHLLGAGSLGTLVAARLVDAGFPIEALTRGPDTVIARTLLHPDGSRRALHLPAADADRPITHLVLAVKAGDVATALAPLAPRLAPDVTLLALQNGLGALDGVALPPAARVVTAVTTDGAWRDGTQVTVAAVNETQAGDGGATPPTWFPLLAEHWPGLLWTTDIRRAQWRKLAVNAVINPLTALHDCPNGALVESAALRAEMVALAAEFDRVAARLVHDWPGDTLARSVEVARRTAANMSSMRADVRAGRATEIDFINGQVVREARRLGLSVPAHERIVAAIRRRTGGDAV